MEELIDAISAKVKWKVGGNSELSTTTRKLLKRTKKKMSETSRGEVESQEGAAF